MRCHLDPTARGHWTSKDGNNNPPVPEWIVVTGFIHLRSFPFLSKKGSSVRILKPNPNSSPFQWSFLFNPIPYSMTYYSHFPTSHWDYPFINLSSKNPSRDRVLLDSIFFPIHFQFIFYLPKLRLGSEARLGDERWLPVLKPTLWWWGDSNFEIMAKSTRTSSKLAIAPRVLGFRSTNSGISTLQPHNEKSERTEIGRKQRRNRKRTSKLDSSLLREEALSIVEDLSASSLNLWFLSQRPLRLFRMCNEIRELEIRKTQLCYPIKPNARACQWDWVPHLEEASEEDEEERM